MSESERRPAARPAETFRMHSVEWVPDGYGKLVGIRLCEEWVPESGRWEPFYAYAGIRDPADRAPADPAPAA